MRASIFQDCRFLRTRLIGADLRQSTFEGCDFTSAEMDGATLELVQMSDESAQPRLSSDQRSVIRWVQDPGSDPEGG
jgi:uncharacterized protein YjbI with pentapeptide repeats